MALILKFNPNTTTFSNSRLIQLINRQTTRYTTEGDTENVLRYNS